MPLIQKQLVAKATLTNQYYKRAKATPTNTVSSDYLHNKETIFCDENSQNETGSMATYQCLSATLNISGVKKGI